jgi:hypothetical protein
MHVISIGGTSAAGSQPAAGTAEDNAATPGEQQPPKAGDAARRSCTGRRASLIFRPPRRRRAPVRIGGQPAGRGTELRRPLTGLGAPVRIGGLSGLRAGGGINGALAQLVARLHGMQKVARSNRAGSTREAILTYAKIVWFAEATAVSRKCGAMGM